MKCRDRTDGHGESLVPMLGIHGTDDQQPALDVSYIYNIQ